MDPLTSKLARRISEERAGKQAGFLQDLKPIADTQHQPAPIRKVGNRLHHRRETGNRAAAQVVTVGKPARQHDQFQIVESTLAVVDVAPRMVRPAGSLTTGFSVTKTSARYMTPQTVASLSARLAWTGRPEAPERLEVADTRSLNDLIR